MPAYTFRVSAALAGMVPPPGIYFESDFWAAIPASSPPAGRRNSAGAVLANVKVEARVGFVTPTWVTPIEILGGKLGFARLLPLENRVSAQAR